MSLADRIVLLRDGSVRQVGTPDALYNRPSHLDVAEFMGFRNRVRGRVAARTGDQVTVVVENATVSGRLRDDLPPGSDATLAVRPEDLVASDDGPLVATVTSTEFRGRDHTGFARMADGTDARVPRRDGRIPRRHRPASAISGADIGVRVTTLAAKDPLPLRATGVRVRLASRGLDGLTLLVLPAAGFLLLLFVYPFLYGLWLSFQPKEGNAFANYMRFFSDPFLYDTIWATLRLALPVTLVNLVVAIPIALRVRLMRPAAAADDHPGDPDHPRHGARRTRLAELSRAARLAESHHAGDGIDRVPVRLLHNYWGVFLSLLITGLPFTFLLTLSYVSGVDPALENAAATLGAGSAARFRTILLPLLLPGLAITFCLSFVQAFSVFPSAVLLGAHRARPGSSRWRPTKRRSSNTITALPPPWR